MLQIYTTQVTVTWPGKRFMNRFYFLADNGIDLHPYQLAKEINQVLIFDTQWFHFLTLMVSEHARFRLVMTRCSTPPGGPRAIYNFPGGGILGGWPFNCPNNFECVEIQWMDNQSVYAKNHNRIGPLGSGATQGGEWFPFFLATCFAFQVAHGTPMLTASGVTFRPCNVDHLGIATIITGSQISWPPSRQKNRRSER